MKMSQQDALRAEQLVKILEVSRRLARPFDLQVMLEQIVESGRGVLDADRGSVFLYDAESNELYTVVSTGTEGIRIPADKGIVGECAQTRATVNVRDAYADDRFNQEIDRSTGYRTRCLLTVPLVGHGDELVGVLQLLNKAGGAFDESDETVAEVLAAQCAVALQRVRMTEQLVEKERLARELSLARDIQMGFLPQSLPTLEGYDFAGLSRPAEETGGDTFDLMSLDASRVAVLLGDATGHGLAPALSVTQVRSMLRIALRLNCDLDALTAQINEQLCEDLPSNRFVTAFLGILDAAEHRVMYHAAGQAPLMVYRAADDSFEWLKASSIPLGLFTPPVAPQAQAIDLGPGDILGLITDGLYEREDHEGEQFGEDRCESIVREHAGQPIAALLEELLNAGMAHGGDSPADDDITLVLVRRQA
jgi:phosphoserine phosphatase